MLLDAPPELIHKAEGWCAHRGAALTGTAALAAYLLGEREITEAQTRAFLDSIVENIPDMIFVKDARELRFQRFNRAGERLLGYPRETLLGKSDLDLFPPAQASAFVAADRRVLASGKVLEIPEEVIQTRSGVRILHTKKLAIPGPDGAPAYLLGISEDITDRKRAEEQRMQLLEERAARSAAEQASLDWSLLAQVSSQLAASLDLAHSLTQVVQLLTPRLADWAVIELQGEDRSPVFSAAHHVDPGRLEALRALQSHALRPAGFPWREQPVEPHPIAMSPLPDSALAAAAVDAGHLSLLKQLRPVSALVTPLMARGRTLGFLTLARTSPGAVYELPEHALVNDLADRLALAVDNVRLHEEARQAIRAREEFLAVAAHELKTPLTTLQLHVQKLLRTESGPGTASMQRADRQVQRLSSLVNDLLDITRLGEGQPQLQREETDLRALLGEVVERLAETVTKAQSVLSLQAHQSAVGYWDRLRLSQVATNLISNAVKYGGGSPIEVTLGASGTQAWFRIRDYGIGIAAEHQVRIFGPFQRAVSERHYGGLGLGLWIAHQIVTAHGGTIQVESATGAGASFTVSLPLHAPPDAPAPP